MAVAVFFLLSGMLAAELAVIGIDAAGVIGAALFVACALVLRSHTDPAPRALPHAARRANTPKHA